MLPLTLIDLLKTGNADLIMGICGCDPVVAERFVLAGVPADEGLYLVSFGALIVEFHLAYLEFSLEEVKLVHAGLQFYFLCNHAFHSL